MSELMTARGSKAVSRRPRAGTQFQRVYKSTNSATAPASQLPDGDMLNQWSTLPTALNETARYRWRCERMTVNGAWQEWSPPVIDGYLPEDGRSINIKGTAVAVTTTTASDVWPNPSVGDIVLNNDHDTTSVDDIDVCETAGEWDNSYSCEINDGYMVASTGHLWTLSAHRTWTDCGQIRGPKGDDGVSPIYAQLDNEMDSVACTVLGRPDSTQVLSTKVVLRQGNTPITIIAIGVVDELSGESYVNGGEKSGVTAEWSTNTGVVLLTFRNTATFDVHGKRVFRITVSADNESRSLYFTANGIRAAAPGENARLFNVMPSLSEVHKKEDGTLKDTVMSFVVKMTYGKTTTLLTTFDDLGEYDLGIMRLTDSGYVPLTFTEREDDTIVLSLSQLYANGNDDVVFALVEQDSQGEVVQLHDRQRVGSVYDGRASVDYDMLPGASVIEALADGTVTTGAITVTAHRIVGSTRTVISFIRLVSIGYYYAEYSVDGGIWTACSDITVGRLLGYGIPAAAVKTAKSGIALRMKHSSDMSTVLCELPPIPVIKATGLWRLDVNAQDVRFTRDYAGVVSAKPAEIRVRVLHEIGDGNVTVYTDEADLPSGITVRYKEAGGSEETATSGDILGTIDCASLLDNGSLAYIDLRLYAGSALVEEKRLTTVWEQQRMLVPAGVYQNKLYQRTFATTPLVLVDSGTHKGEYWYLIADSNNIGSSASPVYAAPGDSSNVWAQASEFEVILVKMLFARFARLGGFIVVDNWFISQYGTLISSGPDTIEVKAANVETLYGLDDHDSITDEEDDAATDMIAPYGWFDVADPMVENVSGQQVLRFRPSLAINALTGEEWLAGGKFHVTEDGNIEMTGEVHATRLQRTLAVVDNISPNQFKVWRVTDEQGIVTFSDTFYKGPDWPGERTDIDEEMWDPTLDHHIVKQEYYGNLDADVICINPAPSGNGAYYILPDPAAAKNRIVEVINVAPAVAFNLGGRRGVPTDGSSLGSEVEIWSSPVTSPSQGYLHCNSGTSYLKLYCDGAKWMVLQMTGSVA